MLKISTLCLLTLLIPNTAVAVPPKEPPIRVAVQQIELVELAPTQPQNKAEVILLIRQTATRYGVDVAYALSIAEAESGFNCKAKNGTSSAQGVYQFINATWLSTMKRMNLPQDLSTKTDCFTNIEAGIFLLSQGEVHHWDASLKPTKANYSKWSKYISSTTE